MNNSNLPIVNVLLSIYKPNLDFLAQQLISIEKQVGVTVHLNVRFDGFDQETEQVLKLLQQKLKIPMKIIYGERIGACASYIKLIESVTDDNFVAFADQDDIWMDDKLISAIGLNNEDLPTLIISGMNIIDENSNIISSSRFSNIDYKIGNIANFRNALVENIFQGARMLINQRALRIIKSSLPSPNRIQMHDAWIYLVLSSEGLIIIDSNKTFYYRQHGNNAIGLKSRHLNRRISRFLSNDGQRLIKYEMAREFAERFPNSKFATESADFGQIPCVPLRQRINCVSRLKLKRQKRQDQFLFYLSLLFL